MELSEVHDCEKCRNKIVGIKVDLFGNTYCGYCGERVDYKAYFKEELNANGEKNNKSIT